MNEITEKLHKQAFDEFAPKIGELANQGMTEKEIVGFFTSYLKGKTGNFYAQQKQLQPIGIVLKTITDKKKVDSKAEGIFYNILENAGIPFKFQYKIGPYRADYLVDGFLVVELDGPHHDKLKDEIRDKYLEKMGYKVMRVPLYMAIAIPDVILDEIKQLINAGGRP